MSISHLLITGLLSVFTSSNNSSPTHTTNYITSTDSHCKVSNPNPQENETITWSGDCVNGFASGQGTVQWYENGEKSEVFTGVFRNGKRHKGRVTWKSGSVYQGSWLNDYPHGYGKLTLPKGNETIKAINSWHENNRGYWQGDVYIVQGIFNEGNLETACSSPKDCKEKQNLANETYITSTNNHCKVLNPCPQENESITWSGDCVNGFANGKGTLQWYDNGKKTDVFVGYYSNGKRQKQGKYTWENGHVYQGEYLNDKKHGKGKYTWNSGDVYQGNFFNGKRHGKGKMTWINGDVYQGDWKDNKQNGKGKYTWKNGSFHQGGWLNDYPHGFGKSTFVKDDKSSQIWKDSGLGHWQGDVYIVQGIFNEGILKIECSSPKECKQKLKK